jgi:hypothetical protein
MAAEPKPDYKNDYNSINLDELKALRVSVEDIIKNPYNYLTKENIEKLLKITLTERTPRKFDTGGYRGILEYHKYHNVDLAIVDYKSSPEKLKLNKDPRASVFGAVRSELRIRIAKPDGMASAKFLDAANIEQFRELIKSSGWVLGVDANSLVPHGLHPVGRNDPDGIESYFMKSKTGVLVELHIVFPTLGSANGSDDFCNPCIYDFFLISSPDTGELK